MIRRKHVLAGIGLFVFFAVVFATCAIPSVEAAPGKPVFVVHMHWGEKKLIMGGSRVEYPSTFKAWSSPPRVLAYTAIYGGTPIEGTINLGDTDWFQAEPMSGNPDSPEHVSKISLGDPEFVSFSWNARVCQQGPHIKYSFDFDNGFADVSLENPLPPPRSFFFMTYNDWQSYYELAPGEVSEPFRSRRFGSETIIALEQPGKEKPRPCAIVTQTGLPPGHQKP